TEPQAYYDEVSDIIDPSKNAVTIGLEKNSQNVLIGSYSLQQIDVVDVAKFANQKGVSIGGVLGHELVEQKTKQLGGLMDTNSDYQKAHAEGIKAENKINNSTRKDSGSTLQENAFGQASGNLNIIYSQNKRNINVTVGVNNNNVTSVSSKFENPPKKKK
ncbi:MAG: hypothetical protein J0I84_20660, partial [Terrimonas sp.]|nr:hypothetical protein [Terrimonas sp.]